jgi:hypothetical protein
MKIKNQINEVDNRIEDIVFEIMLSGVTSIPGIVMELNRQGCWGKEWRAVDVRKLLAGD